MWTRIGFVLLIVLCVLLALAGRSWGADKNWSNQKLPPHWDRWLIICKAEQPSGRPGKWAGVKWKHDGPGVTFPGGCGFTKSNWDIHKPPGAPDRMSQATPAQQLWACYRIYSFFLKASGSHRFASTVWDVNRNSLHWYGFTKETW